MEKANVLAAWIGILLGLASGGLQGLFFHKEKWMGGYGSWERRMLRLGHISFFGIALLNISFAFTVSYIVDPLYIQLPSYFLIIGAVSMPIGCYLAAFRKVFRHFFYLPVASLLVGIAIFTWGIISK